MMQEHNFNVKLSKRIIFTMYKNTKLLTYSYTLINKYFNKSTQIYMY